MTKIIAPISSYDGAVRVVAAGADELYCGVRLSGLKFISYSGRPAACCLQDYDELGRVVDHAHEKGVTVSLTANLPFMADVLQRTVRSFIKSSVSCGVDALIVSDVGTLLLIRDMGLDLPIYAGSYFVARNAQSVEFLCKLGISRLIAPPDSTMSDLRSLVQESPVEVEAFVHGEGCSNVGGNCYLLHSQRPRKEKYLPYDTADVSAIASAPGDEESLVYISKRIPCIFNYEVYEIDAKKGLSSAGQIMPMLDSFTFCSICYLSDLLGTGVAGFKIVGRCASVEFQERVTRTYRHYMDLLAAGQMAEYELEIQRLRQESPELMKLCQMKRCYYAPWSGKERREAEIPFTVRG